MRSAGRSGTRPRRGRLSAALRRGPWSSARTHSRRAPSAAAAVARMAGSVAASPIRSCRGSASQCAAAKGRQGQLLCHRQSTAGAPPGWVLVVRSCRRSRPCSGGRSPPPPPAMARSCSGRPAARGSSLRTPAARPLPAQGLALATTPASVARAPAPAPAPARARARAATSSAPRPWSHIPRLR